MGIDQMSQLTPELQAASGPLAAPPTASLNPFDQGDQTAGQTPTPMRPSEQTLAAPGSMGGALQNALANPANGVPLSYNDRLQAHTNALADAAPPAEKAKPGSWARQLVAGAQSALSTIGETQAQNRQHPGESIFETANRVKDVRQQKAQQQQKAQTEEERDRGLIAKTNVDTQYQQQLLHSLKGKQADEAMATSFSSGQATVKALTAGNPSRNIPGAPIIAKDISDAQLQLALQNKSWDPTKETYYPTSKEPSYDNGKPRLDDDGNPMWEVKYTIVGTPPEIVLDDKKTKDLADNGIVDANGKKYESGFAIPGALGLTLFQQADNNHSLSEAAKQERENAQLAQATTEQKLSMAQASKNLGPDFFHIASQSGFDLNRTMDYITGHHVIPDPTGKSLKGIVDPTSAEFAKQHPNAGNDYMNYMGGLKDFTQIRDKQIEDQEKERNDRAIVQEKLTKDAADKVTESGAIMTDDMKAQIAALPPDRRALVEKYPNEAGSLLAVALGPGDIDFKTVFSTRPGKGTPGLNAQQAVPIILAINPNWSEQQYNSMHNAYKDITQGKDGIQVAQYNNVLQHAAGLQDVMEESARGKNPAFLNTAINALQSKGWGAEAAKINTEVEAVKGEYELLMNSGYKPSEAEQAIYGKIANGSATPGQIGAFTKAVGSVGAVRLEQINEQYKRISGQNLPGILTPETVDAAKHLNLDGQAMRRLGTLNVGGTIFHNPNWKPSTASEIQMNENNKLGQKVGADAAAQVTAPKGASALVHSPDGKTVIGHIVNGRYVPLNAPGAGGSF